MPRKLNNPTPAVPKAPHVVPEWAKKVKAYREEAGKTQVEVQTALKSKINTISLIENGRREFTPAQRTLFFELIGKPEDSSIPAKISDPAPIVTKEVKAAKAAPKKATKVAKAAKPEKAPKVAKAPKKLKAAPKKIPGAEILDPALTSPPVDESSIPGIPEVQPSTRSRKSRKAAADTALKAVTDYVEKSAATDVSPKKSRKARAKQHSLAATAHPGVAEATPLVVEPTASKGISPVKEAVLRDLNRILSSPGLSDSQAKRLHGLFTSLAVNALLGD